MLANPIKKNTFSPLNNFVRVFLPPGYQFLLAVVFLLFGFPTNPFGQIVTSASQLYPGLFDNVTGWFRELITTGEILFVSTSDGLWVINKNENKMTKVRDIGNILKLYKFGEQLLVMSGEEENYSASPRVVNTNKVFWIVDKDANTKKVDGLTFNGREPYQVEVASNKLFVILQSELWNIGSNGNAEKITGVTGGVRTIKPVGEQMVCVTDEGLWTIDGDGTIKNVKNIPQEILSSMFTTFGDHEAMLPDPPKPTKIFPVLVPGLVIESKLTPGDWWGKMVSVIMPENWLPIGKVQASAYYFHKSDKTYIEKHPSINQNVEFRFAKALADVEPSDSKFSPQDQFSYEINWGKNEVYYWVKDGQNHVFPQRKIYYGVPSQYFLASLPFILSAFFILSCFALAPKVGFCHSAIMNPWVRRYFSLGSVPLLLSVFPSLRRYVLRRYSTSLTGDREFTEWKARFISPNEEFLPENFGKRLNDEKRLLLIGQSGIGKTSFFKYLTACYVSPNRPSLPPKIFPVYISLTNYGGNLLEDLIYNQLFAYGKITDKELAPMFLEQGGLLIFLDGVNEVQNVGDRQKLSEFVEKYWTSNYICLSSQQSYPEIENIPKVELNISVRKRCVNLSAPGLTTR